MSVLSQTLDDAPVSIEAPPVPIPRVAVVMVNYRTPDLALASAAVLVRERADMARSRIGDLSLLLVDGGSADGSAERIAEGLSAPAYAGWAHSLALNRNGGFGWANNQAILRLLRGDAPPDFIFLLNPDTRIEPGAVARLTSFMTARADVAVAGAQLLDEQGQQSASAFAFPGLRREWVRAAMADRLIGWLGLAPPVLEGDAPRRVDWVTGAAMMVRAAPLRQIGLFDTGFFLYFEEVEWMHRFAKFGYPVWLVPGARVTHISGAATGVANLKGARVLPPYWYQARNRYFALTRGRLGALGVNLAWFAGRALWRMRGWLGGRRGLGHAAPGESLMIWQTGLIPGREAVRPWVQRWDAPLDEPPGWTENAGSSAPK